MQPEDTVTICSNASDQQKSRKLAVLNININSKFKHFRDRSSPITSSPTVKTNTVAPTGAAGISVQLSR
jgi:hypothetical protein